MANQLAPVEEFPQVDQALVQMGVGGEMEDEEDRSATEEGREGGSGSPPAPHAQTPMETDKSNIYRHPLFPLLALLFEKCEQSTQTSECVSSAHLRAALDSFLVTHRSKDGASTQDPDTDSLMLGALQVLRIHLLELEKVSDLCKDFCSRYIACLRTKMNSDTLLGAETDTADSPGHNQTSSPVSGALSPQGIVVPASALQHGNITVTTVNPTQMVTGGTVYQPITVVTPQGQVVAQGLSPGTIRFQNTQLQVQLNQDLSFFPQQQHSGSQDDGGSRSKRGVLPKQATNVMRSWLFQHIAHPYPTEEEKKQIAIQTNLSLLQVNNWFINARRRILQPMIDSSSSDTPKSRKRANQNRPTQRFWPDSIASATGLPHSMDEQDDNVTMVTVQGMSMEELQSLSSDGATLAMQQVMLGTHSEEDDDEDEEEEEEEDEEEGGMAGLG